MNQPLKFTFFGTPDVASETLEILKSHGYMPSLIVTAPDRPVGRHFVMTPPAVKIWAEENRVAYLQPEKITDEVIAQLQSEPWDLFIVVAYGKILPQALIDIPSLGTLNIHYSLLPRHRGASPVEAAILAGDTETGVTIQQMVFKLDAGPIITTEKIAIDPDDTTTSLRGKLIPIGANLLANVLNKIPAELYAPPTPSGTGVTAPWPLEDQDEAFATKCGKIKKEYGLIDPTTDDPETMWRKYRAYQPWPGLYFMQDGKRIKITQAVFENGTFVIKKVIPEGKTEMNW